MWPNYWSALRDFARKRGRGRGRSSRSSSFRRLASTDSGSIARCRMKGSKATSWSRPRGAMVKAPTPEEEDRRRLCRERKVLIGERVQHVNRVKGLLLSIQLPIILSLRGDAPKGRSEEPIQDVLRLLRRELATHRQVRRLACRLRW